MREILEMFWFWQNWDVTLNIGVVVVAVLYLMVTGPLQRCITESSSIQGIEKVYFLLGLLVYYLALGSPLNLLAHELFSIHMLQMSLLYFVVPPLLLLGFPEYLVSPMYAEKITRIVRFFTKPIASLFLFNGLISLYHIPFVFDYMMGNAVYHFLSHILLFFAACCMWWPILKHNTLKPLYKIGMIFANGMLLTPACAMITFTDQVLFTPYKKGSLLIPILSPIYDQQLGGVVMKITQEVVYITVIAMVFFQWLRSERIKDKEEAIQWQQQQREL